MHHCNTAFSNVLILFGTLRNPSHPLLLIRFSHLFGTQLILVVYCHINRYGFNSSPSIQKSQIPLQTTKELPVVERALQIRKIAFSFRDCAFSQRSAARTVSGRFSLSLEMLCLPFPSEGQRIAPALTLKPRSRQQDRQSDSVYEVVVFTLCKHGCRMRRFNSNVHHKGGTLQPRAARRRFYGNTRSNRCRLIVARSAWTTGTWHRRGSKRHC